jgi:CO/xanthine dehydrogenase Mo-binding subunit
MTALLSRDARGALDRAGFSRRDFLKGSGALVVAFASAAVVDRYGVLAQGINGASSTQLDSWIAVGNDGAVTAYTGKCDFGQGLYTAQMQLVAEELAVPLGRVRLIQCDTSITPDQGTTSGQQSHPANFNETNLALAAATAREALVGLASTRLGVPAADLIASDGRVSLRATPSRSVGYGELVGGRRFNLPLNAAAKRKHPREWSVLGTPVPRLDMREMVEGRFEFVHNVKVPGMLHGRVVRPPEVGAALVRADESSVRDLPGIVKVVVKGNFVGVVAQKQWQAVQAGERLKVEWTRGTTLSPQQDLYKTLRTQPARDTLLVDSGDVEAKLKAASTVLTSTYHHPYQMHGSIGSSCAVADVQGEKATVWSATQKLPIDPCI